MKNWLISLCDRIAARFDCRVVPNYRPLLKRPIPRGSRLHVGCGEQDLPEYIGCDLRSLEHVGLVCRAWDISRFCDQLSEIYSRHMLEHLSFAEMQVTLRDWYRALAPGGTVRIEVPNLGFALRQWQRAVWTEEKLLNRYSDARWEFAGLFGWQQRV